MGSVVFLKRNPSAEAARSERALSSDLVRTAARLGQIAEGLIAVEGGDRALLHLATSVQELRAATEVLLEAATRKASAQASAAPTRSGLTRADE
jgi:hypothetical protein